MLDFALQIAGIAAGLLVGSCLYGWLQVHVAGWMGDPVRTEEPVQFWSAHAISIPSVISMLLVRVGWPRVQTLRPQATPSPRITMLLAVLLPAASLFLAALVTTALLKILLPLGTLPATILETIARTFITLGVTTLLPLPPLDGWRLLSVLLWGEIRPGHKALFPALLLILFVLELLTKFAIIDAFFGPVTDSIFFFLYLIG